eukprot:gene4484-4913_t
MSFRIYVGRLPEGVTEERLVDTFANFGEVSKVDLKSGYGYVYYERKEEADRAIEKMHGTELDGSVLLVENSLSTKDPFKPKPVKRFDLRILVTGLDPRVSWQDLKDWAREAGDVTFTNVFNREGKHLGVIEYKDEKGFENALKVLSAIPISGALVKVEKDEDPYNGEYCYPRPRESGYRGAGRGRGMESGGRREEEPSRGAYPHPAGRTEQDDRWFEERGGRGGGVGGREDYYYHPRDRGYPLERVPVGYVPPYGYFPPPGMRPPFAGYGDPRRGYVSEDYRRGPPPMGMPPAGYYPPERPRSRSRSRERGGERFYPANYPPGPAAGYGYRGGVEPPRRSDDRRSEGSGRESPPRRI